MTFRMIREGLAADSVRPQPARAKDGRGEQPLMRDGNRGRRLRRRHGIGGDLDGAVQLRYWRLLQHQRQLRSLVAELEGRRQSDFGFADALAIQQGSVGATQIAQTQRRAVFIDLQVVHRYHRGIGAADDHIVFRSAAHPRGALGNRKARPCQRTRMD